LADAGLDLIARPTKAQATYIDEPVSALPAGGWRAIKSEAKRRSGRRYAATVPKRQNRQIEKGVGICQADLPGKDHGILRAGAAGDDRSDAAKHRRSWVEAPILTATGPGSVPRCWILAGTLMSAGPEALTRGNAAIWPLSVEHRTRQCRHRAAATAHHLDHLSTQTLDWNIANNANISRTGLIGLGEREIPANPAIIIRTPPTPTLMRDHSN
jgi:hypothetical protein